MLKDEQGSALVTVLIMVTALTVLVGALLTAFTVHHRLARRDLNRLQAFYLAEAGVYKALWRLSGHDGFDIQWRPGRAEIQISDRDTAQISITERGGFLQIESTATFHNQQKQISVLVGQALPKEFNQAIILGGKDFPLVVTGQNRVVGDVTVGKRGVKTGSIKGSRFTGKKPVEGRVHTISPLQMPFFDPILFQQTIQPYERFLEIWNDSSAVYSLNHKSTMPGNTIIIAENSIDLTDSSFTNPVTLISNGDLEVRGHSEILTQLSVIGRGKISISGSLYLDNAVIYARNAITVSGNVKGSMQLLSSGDIQVSDEVELEYPSLLFTAGQAIGDKLIGSLKITDNARITGTIILADVLPDSLNIRNETRFVLEPEAQVTGMVYSTNHTTIKGRIHGLVIADHFYMYESPTTYINWLKDAYIDRYKLGEGLKLPLMFTSKPELEIVSWN